MLNRNIFVLKNERKTHTSMTNPGAQGTKGSKKEKRKLDEPYLAYPQGTEVDRERLTLFDVAMNSACCSVALSDVTTSHVEGLTERRVW